jgi:predicted RNA-binding Zn ribbon-like protein
MADSSPVQVAPGELEFVRAFVNTLDIETGVDQLRDPAGWRAWAGEHALGTRASTADLEQARGIREALREGLAANHDRSPLPPATVDALNAAAERARVTVRFDPSGATLRGADTGVEAALARLVAAVADSMSDGTWSRLKVCVNDECRWAFYDRSRSRTAQWCSMSICGNRAKQNRWRAAREGPA